MNDSGHSSPATTPVLFAAPALPLAHAGHWLVNLMYLAPVVGFLGWLGVVTWRERRDDASSETPRRPDKER